MLVQEDEDALKGKMLQLLGERSSFPVKSSSPPDKQRLVLEKHPTLPRHIISEEFY